MTKDQRCDGFNPEKQGRYDQLLSRADAYDPTYIRLMIIRAGRQRAGHGPL